MADEQDDPEVIHRQMEAQRASLAEKLDRLENKIVETVEGAREAVAETVQTVKDSFQSSVETVRDTVQSSVENVKETFDVPQQVRNHPWAMFGGAVALGFAAGWLINRIGSTSSQPRQPTWGYVPDAYTAGTSHLAEQPRLPAEPAPPPRPGASWLEQLGDALAPEVRKLRGLAIGAALGVVRDLLAQSMPEQIRPQVSEMVDDVTTKLGGERVDSDLLSSLLRPQGGDGQHV